MYQFFCIVKRDFLNLTLNPIWIFYTICFPILLILILGFISSGAYGIRVTSYDYYGVTVMIMNAAYTSTLSANTFLEEQIKGANLRVIFSPLSDFDIYFSKILSTFLFVYLSHLFVIFLLNFTLSVNFGGQDIIYFLIIIFIFDFASSALGVLVCCITKSEMITNQILSNIIFIFSLLGGLYFPIDGFGKVMVILSNFSPLKWIASLSFEVIYDKNFTLFLPVCLGMVVISIFLIYLCKKVFKKEEFL